jgi:hypothetical protein
MRIFHKNLPNQTKELKTPLRVSSLAMIVPERMSLKSSASQFYWVEFGGL